MARYEAKTAAEVVDFEIDWSGILESDQIASSSWGASPDGLALDAYAPTFTPSATQVWLSGGEPDTAYAITNTVTTAGGRTLQQRFFCNVI